MIRKDSHTLNRRSFLRNGAILGGSLLAAGVLGSFDSDLLGAGEHEATALTLEDTLVEAGPQIERPIPYNLETINRNGVVTRLGIMSDAHLAASDNAARSKLINAFETLAWATPGIDAFFMIGDIAYQGRDEEYAAFTEVVTEQLLTHYDTVPVMHLMMGNHDYLSSSEEHFESFFAQHAPASLLLAKQNTALSLPGVTVIKLNGAGSAEADKMDFTVNYDFLAQALDEAASNRPNDAILVMTHEPPEHMSLPLSYESGNFGQGTNLDMVELIAHYPQARLFCGHIHNPLDVPETVNTDLGFTTVHTSTVGSCFFVRNNLVDSDQDGSHGLVLDVMEDGSLVLHRLDFTEQRYFGEPVRI